MVAQHTQRASWRFLIVAAACALVACNDEDQRPGDPLDDTGLAQPDPDPESPNNKRPIANAGSDQAVSTGSLVTLSGKGFDPDGDGLTYRWTLAAEPTGAATAITGAGRRVMSFSPSVDGLYTFELVAGDGALESAADAITITSRDNVDDGDTGSAPSKGLYAPTTVWAIDNFDDGDVSTSDLNAGLWLVSGDAGANVQESGGVLRFGSGSSFDDGRVHTRLSHKFNFFLQPLRFSVRGINFGGDPAARANTLFQLALSSTEQSNRDTPDSMELSVFGDNRIVLSYKTDAPGSDTRTQKVLLDQTLQSVPAELHLVLDQTSFMLTIPMAGGPRNFAGQHGIPISRWADFGSSALSLQRVRRAAGGKIAPVTLDAVEIGSLKFFDAFANDLVESSGSRREFWTGLGDNVVESDGNLKLGGEGSSNSGIVSPTTTDFNFFAQQLKFAGEVHLEQTDGSDFGVARFALTSDQESARDSQAGLAFSVDDQNRVRLGWKVNKRGVLPEHSNVLVNQKLPYAAGAFELQMTRSDYSLTVYGGGGSRKFSGTHSMKWYDWSPTGNASIALETESSAEAKVFARWANLTVFRDQEYYVAPTVLGPIGDGVNLEAPDLDPASQRLASLGLVDVTRPPFNADASGQTDSTHALQHAMDFAREHYLVTFLPPGDYLVSDTLSCAQSLIRRSTSKLLNDPEGPCHLTGSRAGPKRPRLILAPGSPGFSNPAYPKPIVNIWARSYYGNPEIHQPSISYNQMFVNIDISIGQGNSGAIGVRHRGAQGSAVQESTIDATHGFAGLEGGSGSGGSHADITVIGGQYGLYLRTSQPAPTITGMTLSGQSRSAILYGGRQTLSGVGINITVPGHATGPAVKVEARSAQLGQVSLVDSVINFEHPSDDNLAVWTDSSIYLRNVYVKNARTIVRTIDGAYIDGNVNGWSLIDEYAKGINPPPYATSLGSFQYEATLYRNGSRGYAPLVDRGPVGIAPPGDLQSRHLWPVNFPSWESPDAANVKLAPYFARGDGIADDTAAIQQALDENEIVFLPKGYFRISKPLVLHSASKLVGVSRTLSNLLPDSGATAFSNSAKPQPLVITDNDPGASTVLAFLHLRPQVDAPGVYALHWRAGRHSIFRAVNISRLSEYGYAWRPGKDPTPSHTDYPLVRVSGYGGGKWYNFNQGDAGYMAAGYRHILIEGTTQDLSFYQFNPEHAGGEANAEVRNSSHVSFYGIKGESNYPVLWVRDSDDVNVYGYGGNAAALVAGDTYPAGFQQYTPSLFRVERTTNLRLVNLVDEPRVSGGHPVFGMGMNPAHWHMLLEGDHSNHRAATAALDRPVLYRRD